MGENTTRYGGWQKGRFYDQKLGKPVGTVVIAALHAAERSLYTEISTEIGETRLVCDLLIECHGLDMGEDPVPRFDPQGDERFPSDAGDERRPDVQQDFN